MSTFDQGGAVSAPALRAPRGRSRRTILGGAGAALVAAVAAACGPAGGGSAPTGGAPSGSGTLSGKLQVVQVLDFHPDHNAFLKKSITEFATSKGWALDLSDLAGFLGGTDVYQKLQAQKAAGQPVDLIFHGLSGRRLNLFGLTRDVTPLVNQMVQKYGPAYSSARATHQIDGKWVGVPFYDRTGGYWIREDRFAEKGFTVAGGHFERWQGVLEAARAVSNPEANFHGWGMTVNRSGDGEAVVWDLVQAFGGALTDATGQVVTLDTPQTVEGVRWLADVFRAPDNRGLTPQGINSWNDTSNNEAYLAGTIAMASNAGTLYAKAVLDKNPVAEGTTLIQKPLGPLGQRLQGSGGHYFYFMDGSPNFGPASQLAEHLLSDEVQQTLWQTSQGYVVPAYANRWEHPLIKDNRIARAFRPVAFNEPPFPGMAWRGPVTEASEAVSGENVATDMMGEILAGKGVEAAVRDAHNRAVSIYQSFGFKGK
jgi:multiple sugar transport system substrate-binding protein